MKAQSSIEYVMLVAGALLLVMLILVMNGSLFSQPMNTTQTQMQIIRNFTASLTP